MQALVFFGTLLIGIPLLFIFVRLRVAGKMLCLMLEEDKSLLPRLYPVQGDFVYVGDEGYYVYPSRVRLVRYPLGWPRFMQEIVPCALYERGNAEPLEWIELGKRYVSSVEVGAAMEPRWLANVVKGIREAAPSRLEKMLPLLSVTLGVICMLLMFFLMSKMSALQTAVNALKLR